MDYFIHETSVVKTDKIGKGTYIGPFCLIGESVEIGEDCTLYGHCSIGAPPQYKGNPPYEGGKIIINDNTEIREFVTVNLPTKEITYIGKDSVLMANVHVPHDAYLDDGAFIVVGAAMGGFTNLGKDCYLGLNSITHQFSEMGDYCLLAAGSFFKGKSPGGIIWIGTPSRPVKVNEIGIKRNAPKEDVDRLIAEAWVFLEENK
jgi:UDP-N-acetylglucosamine acyltransferase